MLLFALAYLLGNTCLLAFNHLPSILWFPPLLSITVLASLLTKDRVRYNFILLIAFLGGLTLATFSAKQVLQNTIPAEFINRALIAIGTIDSIPAEKNNQTTFILRIKQIKTDERIYNKPIQLRLSWYFAPQTLKVGDNWQLAIRLKSMPITSNAGGFDYRQWLFEERISALGYVQTNKNNILLNSTFHIKLIDKLREHIAHGIQISLNGKPLVGLIEALAVGVRGDITEEQWDILRGTGTNHLFAIAGLHIGFVSGFIYFLISFCWRRLGRLPLYLPTPIAAVLGSLLSAIIYSALAGFSLPTQRAIIMLIVFLLATLFRKKIPLWHSWSLALIAVLAYDPLTILSASFWMSFSAVALIIYGISGRLQQKGIWRHWLYPQWVIAVGLIPISLLFFQQTSLANFAANALAIPWIGLFVLPLSLLGGISWIISPTLGQLILLGAEKLLSLIWPILAAITKLNWLQWHAYIASNWILVSSLISVIVILAPKGIPGRWLGLLWALPLILWQPAKPKLGEIQISVLNINAGMLVVVRTQTHVLIYESAVKPTLNATILLPFLQYLGIKKIDSLIINLSTSQSSNIFSLLDLIPVKQIFINKINADVTGNILVCNNKFQWMEAGSSFSVNSTLSEHKKINTCSLSISQPNINILINDFILAGKIDNNYLKQPEIFISTYKNNNLNILNTIKFMQPKILIFSTQQPIDHSNLPLHSIAYSTAEKGTLNIKINNDESTPAIIYQTRKKHIWD